MATHARHARLHVLGRGNNGAVLQRGSGSVYKWTVDPHEVAIWLAIQSLRNAGHRVPGLPEVLDIRLGEREALIQRADVKPLSGRERHTLDPWSKTALRQGSRWMGAGRLTNTPRWVNRGRRAIDLGLSAPLFRSLRRGVRSLRKAYQIEPLDIRVENLGHGAGRKDSILLLDPGRSPLETALVTGRRAEACTRCPNERALRRAVTSALDKAPSYSDCRIVGQKELHAVMRGHGWRATEIAGTGGFHTEPKCNWRGCKPGEILLRKGHEWALLHEMVHATDVVDRSLSQWLTEGINEATAQEIAAAEGWDHVPTYPLEVDFVRAELAPALGMSVLDLAKLVISDPDGAGKKLADMLSERYGLTRRRWYKSLGPGSHDPTKLKNLLKERRR